MLRKITTFAALCLSLTSASDRFERFDRGDDDRDEDFDFDLGDDGTGTYAICAIVTDDGGKFFLGFTQNGESPVKIIGKGVEVNPKALSQEEIDNSPYKLTYNGNVIDNAPVKRANGGG